MNGQIYGNRVLTDMLTSGINGGHICHAYLIHGKKGIGKKTLCRYIAKGVLCKGEIGSKPCGECRSCKKLDSGSHPDLYELEARDGKNGIHIDTIREIRQDAHVIPNESDCKVYILPNVENMSTGAFNALLKVLEEPPQTAMFILTAESKTVVPDTVLSRCIPLSMYPLADDEMNRAISQIMPEIQETERVVAISQSGGILGRALELLKIEEKGQLDEIQDMALEGIVKLDEYLVLRSMTLIRNDRKLLNEVIEELLVTLRASVLIKHGAKQCVDERQRSLAFMLTNARAGKLFDVLGRAKELNGGNASMTLLGSWLAAKIMDVLQ